MVERDLGVEYFIFCKFLEVLNLEMILVEEKEIGNENVFDVKSNFVYKFGVMELYVALEEVSVFKNGFSVNFDGFVEELEGYRDIE